VAFTIVFKYYSGQLINPLKNQMIYCSNCGTRVIEKVPAGDNRQRYVCDACDTIHYQNPKIVAGCVPVWDNRLLLCRRAIEPRYGLWTLPAGFMENGESTEQAAARETQEEAGAIVKDMALYGVFSIPKINQVAIIKTPGAATSLYTLKISFVIRPARDNTTAKPGESHA
jgi:ADP-ribose pyrophosphatase YjhB (NUDIX family)